MFLEENLQENRIIKVIKKTGESLRPEAVQQDTIPHALKARSEKLKPWLWFVVLWFAGLLGTLILAYATKGLFWIGRLVFYA